MFHLFKDQSVNIPQNGFSRIFWPKIRPSSGPLYSHRQMTEILCKASHTSGLSHFAGKVTSSSPIMGGCTLPLKAVKLHAHIAIACSYCRHESFHVMIVKLLIWFAFEVFNDISNHCCYYDRLTRVTFYLKCNSLAAGAALWDDSVHSRLGTSLTKNMSVDEQYQIYFSWLMVSCGAARGRSRRAAAFPPPPLDC